VGIVTPTSPRWLSAPIDIAAHQEALIAHYATMVGNVPFGVVGRALRERDPHHGGEHGIRRVERALERDGRTATASTVARRRQPAASLYRIHLLNARCTPRSFMLTAGSQDVLAEMYAIGLLASFCITTSVAC